MCHVFWYAGFFDFHILDGFQWKDNIFHTATGQNSFGATLRNNKVTIIIQKYIHLSNLLLQAEIGLSLTNSQIAEGLRLLEYKTNTVKRNA